MFCFSSRSQLADPDTSYREKTSASSCCSTTDYSCYGQSSCGTHDRHHKAAPSVTGSSLMSSVSHSDKDSGFSGSVKRKDKHDTITITYWLWGEPIPYRTSLPGKCVTLGQFKGLLPPRRGNYRWASFHHCLFVVSGHATCFPCKKCPFGLDQDCYDISKMAIFETRQMYVARAWKRHQNPALLTRWPNSWSWSSMKLNNVYAYHKSLKPSVSVIRKNEKKKQ